MGGPHFTIDFRLGNEGGNGVNNHHINRAGADQQLADFQGLLTRIRLGDEQLVDVHPQTSRPGRIQSVLGIDKRRHTSPLPLGAGGNAQSQGRLARGFGAEDLHHATTRHTPPSQGQIEADRPRGYAGNDISRLAVQTHDRALAECLFDLAQGPFEGLEPPLVLGDGIGHIRAPLAARGGFMSVGLHAVLCRHHHSRALVCGQCSVFDRIRILSGLSRDVRYILGILSNFAQVHLKRLFRLFCLGEVLRRTRKLPIW